MRAQMLRHKARQLHRQTRPVSMMEMAMDGVRRAWYPRQRTSSRKPSCGASAANSNRRAWQGQETRSRCNKLCAGKKKLGATIHALAAPERSTRSVTGRKLRPNRGAPSLSRFLHRACPERSRRDRDFDFLGHGNRCENPCPSKKRRDKGEHHHFLMALKVISFAGLPVSCFHSVNSVA